MPTWGEGSKGFQNNSPYRIGKIGVVSKTAATFHLKNLGIMMSCHYIPMVLRPLGHLYDWRVLRHFFQSMASLRQFTIVFPVHSAMLINQDAFGLWSTSSTFPSHLTMHDCVYALNIFLMSPDMAKQSNSWTAVFVAVLTNKCIIIHIYVCQWLLSSSLALLLSLYNGWFISPWSHGQILIQRWTLWCTNPRSDLEIFNSIVIWHAF